MKRAILFFNGDLTNLNNAKKYIQNSDCIIGVDGGTKYILKLGMKPDVIIGDLDSLSPSVQKKLQGQPIEWITFNREKDATDSELALKHAIKKGYKSLLVYGLLGSRLDHLLTNIFALTYLYEKNVDITFIEGNQVIRVISDKITLKGKPGDVVSLIPLKGDVSQVTTTNLQYPLKKEDLYFGYSRGISNVMTGSTAEISVKEGLLLAIHTKQ